MDLRGQDPEKELPYSHEDAVELVKNSAEFDKWINDAVYDLDNFRTSSEGADVEKTGKVAS